MSPSKTASFVTGKRFLLATALTLTLGLAISGCAKVVPAPVVEAPPSGPSLVNIRHTETNPIIELEANADGLLVLQMDRGDPLPGDLVGPIEINGTPLMDALKMLVRPYGLAVAPSNGAAERPVTLSDPSRRPLAEAIDILARQAGVFYRFEAGVLYLDGTRTFSVRVPNVARAEVTRVPPTENDPTNDKIADQGSTSEAFGETFSSLGATNVNVDTTSGLISFEADYPAYRHVSDFLKRFELSRDLIVYEAWIYEVSLGNGKEAGIKWNDFGRSLGNDTSFSLKDATIGDAAGGVASTAAAAAGLSLGILGNPGDWIIDLMFNFLSTQGEAKALAQPTMAVIGGRPANIFVGDRQSYVSRLRISESEDDNTAFGSDIETEELETGIKMRISGDVINGVVETDIDLSLIDLLEIREIEAGETFIQLPHTAERRIGTEVRARPGDVIIIGGLIQDQGSRNQEDLLLLDVPINAQSKHERTELVMMLRPRLIKLRPTAEAADKAFTEKPVEIGPVTRPNTKGASAITPAPTPTPPAEFQLKTSPNELSGFKAAVPVGAGQPVTPEGGRAPATLNQLPAKPAAPIAD